MERPDELTQRLARLYALQDLQRANRVLGKTLIMAFAANLVAFVAILLR